MINFIKDYPEVILVILSGLGTFISFIGLVFLKNIYQEIKESLKELRLGVGTMECRLTTVETKMEFIEEIALGRNKV